MLLRVENVIKSYPDTEVPVLRGISFGLDRGDMLALTGESGSGKSTLLHLTGGLDIADSGEVIVDGTDLTPLDDAGRVRLSLSRCPRCAPVRLFLPVIPDAIADNL